MPANSSKQVSCNLPEGHTTSAVVAHQRISSLLPFFGIAKSRRPLRDSVSGLPVRLARNGLSAEGTHPSSRYDSMRRNLVERLG